MNSPLHTNSSKYKSQRVDFGLIKYLFLKSPNLGTFQAMGSLGKRTIIKKIPVTSGPGEMIVDAARSALDTLDCSTQKLKALRIPTYG